LVAVFAINQPGSWKVGFRGVRNLGGRGLKGGFGQVRDRWGVLGQVGLMWGVCMPTCGHAVMITRWWS
jgi:hypothetical protein